MAKTSLAEAFSLSVAVTRTCSTVPSLPVGGVPRKPCIQTCALKESQDGNADPSASDAE